MAAALVPPAITYQVSSLLRIFEQYQSYFSTEESNFDTFFGKKTGLHRHRFLNYGLKITFVDSRRYAPLVSGSGECQAIALNSWFPITAIALPARTMDCTIRTVLTWSGPRSMKSPTKIAVRSGWRQAPPLSPGNPWIQVMKPAFLRGRGCRR